eukprot:TRINITY_DN12084_c0_g1_i2.p1 TRINITY_DN12084_c0_g1~~TRINITY_DN12084_c0_g1_i2.p1  ORF type:complete len:779 (+),score=168.53 TRINITY_DN12084_c0_g1_i2:130-2466(+)
MLRRGCQTMKAPWPAYGFVGGSARRRLHLDNEADEDFSEPPAANHIIGEKSKPESWKDKDVLPPEPAAEPSGWMEEPAAEPSGPRSPAMWAAVALVLARVVRRTQRSSLRHWYSAVEHLAREEPPAQYQPRSYQPSRKPPVAAADTYLVTIAKALKRKAAAAALVRALEAWVQVTGESQAKRAVRTFCSNYRAKVLFVKTIAALKQFAAGKAAASAKAAEVLERGTGKRFVVKLELALEAWRGDAARSSLRNRSGDALSRFVRTSRLRQWYRGWAEAVWWLRRLASTVFERQHVADAATVDKAWRVWRLFLRRCRRGQVLARHAEAAQVVGFMRRWQQLHVAKCSHRWKLASRCLRTWRRLCDLTRAAEELLLRRRTRAASLALARWSRKRGHDRHKAALGRKLPRFRLRTTLGAWMKVFRVVRHDARRISRHALRSWRFCIEQLRKDHEAWIAHEEAYFAKRAAKKRAAAVASWRSWLLERRRLRAPWAVAACAQDGQPHHMVPKTATLLRGVVRWREAAVLQRSRRAVAARNGVEMRKHMLARRLWRWRDWTEQNRSQREQSQQAISGFQHISKALQWERIHDACSHWSSWAKARRSRGTSTGHGLRRSAVQTPSQAEEKRFDWDLSGRCTPARGSRPHSSLQTPSMTPSAVARWSPQENLWRAATSAAAAAGVHMTLDETSISEHLSASGYPSHLLPSYFGSSTPALPHQPAAGGRRQQRGGRRKDVQQRWLRWTVGILLSAKTALPRLQWSFELWRGAVLRAELLRLRWLSLTS